MPELPEVETVVRELRRTIVGKKIKAAESDTPQLFETKSLFRSIGKLLAGDLIHSISRHGKYILIHLKSNRVLIVHLKMTGHFLFLPSPSHRALGKKQTVPHSHDRRHIAQFETPSVRFRIAFSDGLKLLFSDVRKFGRIWLIPEPHLFDFFGRRKLAHDALSPQCNEEYLHTQLSRNRAVKALLLDQSCVAGIGNIYADEILFAAKVHPLGRGSLLAEAEVRRIFKAMGNILKLGIKMGGTSIRDYRKPSGQYGSFQHYRKVYQRTGEPCSRCRTKIQRIVIAGRGTHFCPQCQKI